MNFEHSLVDRHRKTGAMLRELLENTPRYQRKWYRYAQRDRPPVNAMAVARMMSEQLILSGTFDYDQTPHSIKARVARALAGTVLTAKTLEEFIEAFEMTSEDAARLRFTLSPAPSVPDGISNTLRRKIELARV
ncbi:hypothetical protein G3I76_54050, partial [Streptomyces sp. SID11233]|nr:hypothetical protein [Streptomyces sp. SID11233]